MGRHLIETVMGAVVLAVAVMFLIFAYSHADLEDVSGYELRAEFTSVGGLERGADVKINGIKIGTVDGSELDPVSFNAVVRMSVMPHILLPKDSVASIASDGLLGGKYLKLEPGRAPERIPAGGTIARTKDFKSIEDMVGELIFLATSEPKADAKPTPQLEEAQSPSGAN